MNSIYKMEKQEMIERDLMNEGEFKKYLEEVLSYNRISPETIGKYRSIGRAIRRGHVTQLGMAVPRRPFNNRSNTSRRKGIDSRNNVVKKTLYEQFMQYYGRASKQGLL